MAGLLLVSGLLVGSLAPQAVFSCLVFVFAFLPVRVLADIQVTLPAFKILGVETMIAGALLVLMGIRMLLYPAHNRVTISRIWISWVFIGLGALWAVLLIILEVPEGFRMFYRLAFSLIAFGYFATCLKPADIEKTLNLVILVALGISLAILFYNVFLGGGFQWSAGVERLEGFGSASDHAYSMGLLTIICYGRMRIGGRWQIFGPLAAIFGLQVLLTVTRGGIFATALGLMAFEMFGKRHGLSLRVLGPAFVLLGLIAAVLIHEPLQERIFATHYRDVSTRTELSAAQRLEISFERSGRGPLWRYVFDKVGQDYHLFTGYGLGRAEVDVLRDVGGVLHNEYLRVLYEMGVLGLLVFVASLWQLWRLARAGVRRADTRLQQTVAGIGIAVITVYAAGAMVDNMLNKYKSMGLFLYMFAAFILLLDVRPEKPAPALAPGD